MQHVLAQWVGAGVLTLLLTRLANKFFAKWLRGAFLVVTSSAVVGFIVLMVASETLGTESAVLVVLPCLIIWLIMDLLNLSGSLSNVRLK